MEPETQDEPASGRFGVDEGGIIIEVLYRCDTGLEIPDEGGMASVPSSAGEDAVTPESLIESPHSVTARLYQGGRIAQSVEQGNELEIGPAWCYIMSVYCQSIIN